MKYKLKLNGQARLVKSGHPETYRKVCDLAALIDPMNLVKYAGPDEYSIEVYDIMANLSECRNHHDLRQLYQEVFEEWFGLSHKDPESPLVTAPDHLFIDLWNWLLEHAGGKDIERQDHNI